MDLIAAKQFIKEEIEDRWPRWQPTYKEICLWVKLLQSFPKDCALEAIEETYIENQSAPKIKVFLGNVRTKSYGKVEKPGGPSFEQTHFTKKWWIFNRRNGRYVETSPSYAGRLQEKYNNGKFAEEMKDDWVIYENTTLNEILTMRYEISKNRSEKTHEDCAQSPNTPAPYAKVPPVGGSQKIDVESGENGQVGQAEPSWFNEDELKQLNLDDGIPF